MHRQTTFEEAFSTQLLLNEIRDLYVNVLCRSDPHPSQHAPKMSNASKSGTLSDSQIAQSVLLNSVDFNRERTNKRNAPNDADFNEVRMPEFGQEQQSSFKKSDGGTKSNATATAAIVIHLASRHIVIVESIRT